MGILGRLSVQLAAVATVFAEIRGYQSGETIEQRGGLSIWWSECI